MSFGASAPQTHEFALRAPEASKGSTFVWPTFGAIGVAAAVTMTAVARASGSSAWEWVFFVGGLVLAWFTIAWLWVVRGGRRGRLRLTHDSCGVTLTAAASLRVFEASAPGVLTIGSLVSLWQLITGIGDVRALIALAVVTLVSWKPMVVRGRNVTIAHAVRLSCEGVDLVGIDQGRFAWDQLAAVALDPQRKGYVFASPTHRVVFNPADLRSDPALVTELIEYYRAHPELRDELSDHRSIQRIRFHQFTDTVGSEPQALFREGE